MYRLPWSFTVISGAYRYFISNKTIFTKQSSTKPNFGVFLVIYIVLKSFKKYVQYESTDNVIKYYGSVITHDWDGYIVLKQLQLDGAISNPRDINHSNCV